MLNIGSEPRTGGRWLMERVLASSVTSPVSSCVLPLSSYWSTWQVGNAHVERGAGPFAVHRGRGCPCPLPRAGRGSRVLACERASCGPCTLLPGSSLQVQPCPARPPQSVTNRSVLRRAERARHYCSSTAVVRRYQSVTTTSVLQLTTAIRLSEHH